MNKFLIPAIAVSAVTLLGGCQAVSVRHHYPEPARVVESHHRVVVIPPARVIRVTPAVRVVAPVHRHEKPGRGHQEHARPPAHRDNERRQRQPRKVHPQVKVIPVTPQVKAARGFAAQVVRRGTSVKSQKAKAHSGTQREHDKSTREDQDNQAHGERNAHRRRD